MTAIACYLQKEHGRPHVWAVGDSRISQPGSFGGYRRLNEHAVKVFSVPFIVQTGGAAGPILYAGSFGFCYSGSSVTGLNVHAALSHLVRVLQSPSGTRPSLRDIVEFVRSLLTRYVLEYALIASENAACECAILGSCPVEGQPMIFVLRPDTSSDVFQYRIEKADLSADGAYILLGDRKPEIAEMIEASRSRYNFGSINWWRSPWHGIQDAVTSNKFDTIGGHVQIGASVGPNFVVFGRTEKNGTKVIPEFLGLSVVQEDTPIGPCRVGIPLMLGLDGFQEAHHR